MNSFLVVFVALCGGIVSTTSPPIELQGCYINGQMYQPGEHFMDDCNSCTCGENGLSACTLMACPPKSCEYNGNMYEDGDTFDDDCNACFCSDGLVGCTRMSCPLIAKRTSVPYLPGKCWFNGVFYDVGDSFKDSEDCNTCRCLGQDNDTAVACTKMSCH